VRSTSHRTDVPDLPSATRPRASLRSPGLTLLFIGESLVLVANGIAFTAIAAGAVSAGLDSTVVGAAGSAFYAGLFAVYLAGPIFVTRMGLRTMALARAPITPAGLAALLLADLLVWFAGRFVANGIGGIIGPAIASGLDMVAPGKGVFLLAAAVFAALGLMLAGRRMAR
jgi:hypothetical protein